MKKPNGLVEKVKKKVTKAVLSNSGDITDIENFAWCANLILFQPKRPKINLEDSVKDADVNQG